MNQVQKLPPNLTMAQVSRRLKISPQQAHLCVRLANYAFRTAYPRQKIWPEQWQKVDWSLTNTQIAQSLGLSGERVRQVRADLGIAKARPYHRKTAPPEIGR